VRLVVAFAAVGALMVVVSFSGYPGAAKQSRAAHLPAKGAVLTQRVQQVEFRAADLTQRVQQVEFRAADLDKAQLEYAFDILAGVRDAASDTSEGRRSFLRETASMRREIAEARRATLDDIDRANLAKGPRTA
jgi:hypothetical protein